MISIGELDLWPILDGRFTFSPPPGALPAATADVPTQWEHVIVGGRWLMDIGGFLVRSGDRLVMVDTGAGQGDGQPVGPPPAAGPDEADPLAGSTLTQGSFHDSLAAAGFRPEDVTDVVLSHLHFDHIGWVSRAGQPYFPAATYRVERNDLDHFLGPDHDDTLFTTMWGATPTRDRLTPVLERIEPWDGDTTVAPGVDCRHAPGHTPGSSVVVLSSGEERALLLGDAVHCPAELVDPPFPGSGDVDEARAEQTRELIRREVEDARIRVSSPHFPGLRFGRVVLGEGRRSWVWEGGRG